MSLGYHACNGMVHYLHGKVLWTIDMLFLTAMVWGMEWGWGGWIGVGVMKDPTAMKLHQDRLHVVDEIAARFVLEYLPHYSKE